MIPPITCTWDGESFVPLTRFARACDKHFVVGQEYPLVVHEERSTSTHNHEFAWLKTAWENLPERIADQFASPEHLRKRALIDAGFYDEQIVDAGSNAAALRVASFIRGMDDFAYVVVRGAYVVKRTAKSQSRRAMNKKDFQASKSAIMDVVAAMIGVSADALAKAEAA